MKLFLNRDFKYSEDGNTVITVAAGKADIPDKFVNACISSGVGEKMKHKPLNKAKNAPKNK